ncbi:MAG: Rrf2 family transcriptional regulator [Phycisphaerales bacterium]|nr:Rrf2 family transcriptional regulator [Phycisphaerales bacterium]
MFSDACEYGFRSVLWLAQRPAGPFTVREIAVGTRTTPGYLVKVLQHLGRAGILSAQRGRQGGFTLERAPAEITVLDIINAVDPFDRINFCPLGLEQHGTDLCPLHRSMDETIATLEANFRNITIASLLRTPTRSTPLCGGLVSATLSAGEHRGDADAAIQVLSNSS